MTDRATERSRTVISPATEASTQDDNRCACSTRGKHGRDGCGVTEGLKDGVCVLCRTRGHVS